MDLSELKGIINLMQKSDLTELEIELQDLKLRMARPGGGKVSYEQIVQQPQAIPAPAHIEKPQTQAAEEKGIEVFKSPMVGTFYRRPSPDDSPFVEVGQQIKTGDVLCIVEAMKVMNEIQSELNGEIVEILAEDGDSVEYSQPLYKIRKG